MNCDHRSPATAGILMPATVCRFIISLLWSKWLIKKMWKII